MTYTFFSSIWLGYLWPLRWLRIIFKVMLGHCFLFIQNHLSYSNLVVKVYYSLFCYFLCRMPYWQRHLIFPMLLKILACLKRLSVFQICWWKKCSWVDFAAPESVPPVNQPLGCCQGQGVPIFGTTNAGFNARSFHLDIYLSLLYDIDLYHLPTVHFIQKDSTASSLVFVT